MKIIKTIAILFMLFTNLHACIVYYSEEELFTSQFIKVANMTDNKELQKEAENFQYPYNEERIEEIEKNCPKEMKKKDRDRCIDGLINDDEDEEYYKKVIIKITSDSNNPYYQELIKKYPENKEQLKLLINNTYKYETNGNFHQKGDTYTEFKLIVNNNKANIIFSLFSLFIIFLLFRKKIKLAIVLFIIEIFLWFIVRVLDSLLR